LVARQKGTLRASLLGDEAFKRQLARKRQSIGHEVEGVIKEYLIKIEASAKDKLDYDVLNRRTSTLIRSVNHRMTARGLDSFGEVGTPVVYGPVHEFGATITNAWGRGITVKIPKRPWLIPSFEEHVDDLISDISNAIDKGLSDAN